jgi:hypothetical protein
MKRIWGRVYASDGSYVWQAVTTDSNGSNDYVYITNLIQVLKLNPGESPFYANYGIPALKSVQTQIAPDYYMALTQSQFSGYFAALVITKVTSPTPSYRINLTTNAGVKIETVIPV